MKTIFFTGVLVLLAFGLVSAQDLLEKTQTINTLDTVVFDLSKAVINGNVIEFPVSLLTDDTIYALDFSLKYNHLNVDYDTITDLTNYLQTFSFYNTMDSTIRFTSNSFQAISNDTSLVAIRFTILGAQFLNSDLNTLKAYLNGIACSIKLVNFQTTAINQLSNNDYVMVVKPNPVSSLVKVSLKSKPGSDITIKLIDSSGRIIETFFNDNSWNSYNEAEYETTLLENGIYFIKMFVNNQVVGCQKLLVVH